MRYQQGGAVEEEKQQRFCYSEWTRSSRRFVVQRGLGAAAVEVQGRRSLAAIGFEEREEAAGGAGNQTPVWSGAPGAATKWSAQGDGGEDGVVAG